VCSRTTKIFFTLFFVLAFLVGDPPQLRAANVTLGWSPNPESNIAGYVVSYGTSSGNYSTRVDVGNVTMYSVSLPPGTYYFAAQAYNTIGQQSGYSAEVSTTIPGSSGAPTTSPLPWQSVASSSDYSPQYAAVYAVDGDPSTYWSSQYSDPQWLSVDLGARYTINRVRLAWQIAYAANFQIAVSDDAVKWTVVATVTNGSGGVNDLAVSGAGRYVAMWGLRRGTQWGYALSSFDVFGVPAAASTNVALGQRAVSSSDYSAQYAAVYAVDGNPSTYWSSQYSDPQWISIDLGARFAINRVTLTWQIAYAADFQIAVSDDAVNWTVVAAVTNGSGGVNDLPVSGAGRYVAMWGMRRGTQWGYALSSFDVYGQPAP
jgi:hypothetical protein